MGGRVFPYLGSGVAPAAYASRPPAGIAGRIYYETDGLAWFDDGTVWRPIVPPGVLGTQPPAASAFTKLGGTTATLLDNAGTLQLKSDTNNEVFEGPSLGSTFQVDCAFMTAWNTYGSGQESLFALALEQHSNGKFVRFGIYCAADGTITVQTQNFTNRTTNSGGATGVRAIRDARGPFFLRAVGDATNITCSWSTNGLNWQQLYQAAKASFCTVDTLALFTNDSGGNVTITDILSLRVQ